MTEWTVNNKLNAWYQKLYHIKLPKQYITKALLYFSTSFTPVSLFATNEPGIWLDPSDVANLDWRRNLLTYTEQFDNAAWTKGGATVSTNTDVAPDGTTTADRLIEDTSTGDHRTFQTASFTSGLAYTFSVYVKPFGRSLVQLTSSGVATFTATFDVTAGTVTNTVSGTASISAVGNGWFRLAITATASSTASSNMQVRLVDTGVNTSYTGNGTSGVLVWGAQLEVGSVATDYQRISDVNTEVLERFPKTTMFQDRAGSTAVTTPGQSVGLRLDKSKGLVLGPELVTNGDFSAGATGWTAGNSATIAATSGVAQVTQTSSNLADIRQTLTTVAGRIYRVSCEVASQNGASIVAVAQDTSTFSVIQQSAAVTSASLTTVSFVFTANAATTRILVRFNASGASGNTFTTDNISVKELPGNHAVANADAARGIYGIEPVGGRRNLLTFTEQFDNAIWAKGNTTVTAPDANGWIRLQASTTASILVSQTVNGAGSASGNTFTIQVKKGSGATDANRFGLRNSTTSTDLILLTFNYDTGVVSGTGASDVTVTAGANAGEWTLRLTPSSGISAGSNLIVYTCFVGATEASTEFAFVRYPQLETGSTATAYQRVTTQYDVIEAGKQTLHYVQYDGSDDGYVTPTITPGTDKVQVFAGVRKLGDPVGIIAELSPTVDTNNGSVILYSTSPSKWGFASRGTTLGVAEPGGYSPPLTSVLTGLGDISGDRATIRVNGTQITQTTSDQGTGNFLAYPIYIGRRGGTTFPFNGRDYGIVVRFGANLDAATIASTEAWLGSKTGFSAPVISGAPTIGVT